MVTFYGDLYRLPPLNAKVYVYLMFDTQGAGHTFDDLLLKFNVSKSSLSNALQMLLQHRFIEYITPIDSRKRQYRINPQYMGIRFGNILNKLEKEKELMARMALCCKKEKSPNATFIKSLDQYGEILNKHIKTIDSTIKNLQK
ncbi:MAG: ArsR family transcriptional regulator [Niabella sp.]|nr:ArsR family transcriptional regulator [Niabella sp.]